MMGFWLFMIALLFIAGVFCILMGLAGSPGGLLILGIVGIQVWRVVRKKLNPTQ